jgi:hypothetical protein
LTLIANNFYVGTHEMEPTWTYGQALRETDIVGLYAPNSLTQKMYFAARTMKPDAGQ